MRHPRLIPLVLVALALAADVGAAEGTPNFPEYLAPDAVDFTTIIPPAPDEMSFAARAEQDLVRQVARHRTAEQARLAQHFARLDVFKMLAPVIGDWASANTLPRTAVVFEQIRRAGRPAIEAAKNAWNRDRPYVLNPGIEPAVERPRNTSYPSGHSADAMIYASMLIELFPELAADWQQQAALVSWSRLVGGVHYPSDLLAGKLLGAAIARELLKSPAVLRDLEDVRHEIRTALAARQPAA